MPRRLLIQRQQWKEPLVRAIHPAVLRHEIAVVLDEPAEARLIERVPVEGRRPQIRRLRRRRQIPEEELGHDTEVAPAAALMPPEQILLLWIGRLPADRYDLRAPLLRDMHHLDRIEIVHRQPMQPRQQAIPTTRHMPARAHRMARSPRNRHPILLRQRRIDIQQLRARFHAIQPGLRIPPHRRHRRQIDDHPAIVATGKILIAMPAAAHRQPQPAIHRHLHRLRHLPRIAAQRDIRRRPNPPLVEPMRQIPKPRIVRKHLLEARSRRPLRPHRHLPRPNGQRPSRRSTHLQETPSIRGECHWLVPPLLTRCQPNTSQQGCPTALFSSENPVCSLPDEVASAGTALPSAIRYVFSVHWIARTPLSQRERGWG